MWYLTRVKGYEVKAIGSSVQFRLKGSLLFTATVNASNVAYLDGKPVPSIELETAGAVSTLPADRTLWHRRLVHLNDGDLQNVIRLEMVKGLALQDSATSPDPICEPCLAGKLHRGLIVNV